MKQLLTLSIILCTIACSSGKPKVASSSDEQCIATTQKGTRCQLEVEGNSSYCSLHNPEYDKCQATTKSGKPCSRNAERGSNYCWQHQ
ncbi:MAG: hypothetical protein MJZ29_07295 [Bacteroidaceae bacterium]|nr:hypothetical protein [Bacteroidaceae bacterium]